MVKHKNVEVTENDLVTEAIALLAGFSNRSGLEAAIIKRGSVNADDMIEWLKKLKHDPSTYYVV